MATPKWNMNAGNTTNQYYGKSTWEKPSDDCIPHGSTLIETDTGKMYFWDAEDKTWVEQ